MNLITRRFKLFETTIYLLCSLYNSTGILSSTSAKASSTESSDEKGKFYEAKELTDEEVDCEEEEEDEDEESENAYANENGYAGGYRGDQENKKSLYLFLFFN